ncbi:hypothetical protein ZIOFF_028609 [Zingiber officinale]|uniref:DUF4378 domain-containing protein n=2 Tax=Zingiber officinale TaxID=94328 RepID=A0A8J5L931_ZINOF|nr:hypothetical protein ZIOFF_028609 [Zingiber officinale]
MKKIAYQFLPPTSYPPLCLLCVDSVVFRFKLLEVTALVWSSLVQAGKKGKFGSAQRVGKVLIPFFDMRQPVQPQRDNVGCMWGLMSLFDFRRGQPTQKLLSDKRHGSNRRTGTGYSKTKLVSLRNSSEIGTLVDETREDQASLGSTSVKTLIEEEMSQLLKTNISRDETQRATSSLQTDALARCTNKPRCKKLKLVSDNVGNNLTASSSLAGIHSGSIDLTEISSSNFDIPAFLLELYSYTCQQASADSNCKFDFVPSLESICLRGHYHLGELDDSLDEKISLFPHTIADFVQIIVGQKSIVEGLNHGQLAVQRKKLVDQLDSTNSDNELFKKLLQGPDSSLLKYIQSLYDVQVRKTSKLGSERSSENVALLIEENDNSGKCNESDINQLLQKQKRYNFFLRKDKLKGTKQTKENPSSEALNRIVVLRPNRRTSNSSTIISQTSSLQSHDILKHNENSERIASNFSMKEIKRRIRQIINENRKARHVISRDGILHRIPVTSSDYGDSSELINGGSAETSSLNHCRVVKILHESFDLDSKSKKIVSAEEFKSDGNSHISRFTARSESLMYEEAKKHLAEMLDTRVDSFLRIQASKPLDPVLAVLDFSELSPAPSPQRYEFFMSSKETGDPSSQQSDQGELAESSSLAVTSVSTDLNMEGNTEIIELFDTKSIVEFNELALPLKSSGNELINERCEEESITSPCWDSGQEKSPTVVHAKPRPSNLIRENLMALESINEKQEQPSPVSVLGTLTSDDINSLDSAEIEKYYNQVEHQQASHEEGNVVRILESSDLNDSIRDDLEDYEARFDYVKAVLEASDLTNEFPRKWDIEDQLIKPSLFNEIGIFFCFLKDDPKLLFDCINEVLLEIHERFLKCSPWLFFIKKNILPIPLGESLIHEVSKGLEWHLQLHLPNTLDQIVKKDLEGRCWMDLRFEAENITEKICDAILGDVVKQIVCDSWC